MYDRIVDAELSTVGVAVSINCGRREKIKDGIVNDRRRNLGCRGGYRHEHGPHCGDLQQQDLLLDLQSLPFHYGCRGAKAEFQGRRSAQSRFRRDRVTPHGGRAKTPRGVQIEESNGT